ncbi:MAG: hypothetical protein WD359_05895 [Dehalococcoidia bacterium]
MSRRQRYMRTERRRPDDDDDGRPSPDVERFEEERGRYGSFAMWMVALLLVATIAAIAGTIIFWPD